MKPIIFLLFLHLAIAASAQNHSHTTNRVISFPDVPGYLTLSTDLHQHTVFSDGHVWPQIRVLEAARDSIDVISLTEHLEYQPWRADIPHPDRNRSYELAKLYAKPYDILVAHGSEITIGYPPGHTNALFIQDANKMLNSDSMKVFEEAGKQDAFIFWNHPDWRRDAIDGIARIKELHVDLIRAGLLHGIEVVNEQTYSEEALQIALDFDLTIMGNSDIHDLVDWQFEIQEGGHRPVTLVFAKERTLESVKEALFEKRTVVYYRDMLIGREAHVIPLLNSMIEITDASFAGASQILEVKMKNHSNALVILANETGYTFKRHGEIIMMEPFEEIKLEAKVRERTGEIPFKFKVMNAITAPKQHPSILLTTKSVN